jgi:NAD(P)H-dependent FMN reductase
LSVVFKETHLGTRSQYHDWCRNGTNAIDFLYNEWVNKVAGFIAYGGVSGARAVENLRLVMGELQVATVRAQVGLSMFTDFENFSVFQPAPIKEKAVNSMLDRVIAWGGALKTLREKQQW